MSMTLCVKSTVINIDVPKTPHAKVLPKTGDGLECMSALDYRSRVDVGHKMLGVLA